MPELTACSFVPDPFAERPGARLYRTGDRATWLRDGRIAYNGRIGRQVKVRGHRIEPEEIEKISAELEIYTQHFKQSRSSPSTARPEKQSVVFETDLPDYFLSIAQKRAAEYYRAKYALTPEASIG